MARCQKQGLRYVIAYMPKDQLHHRNNRTTGTARYSTHAASQSSGVVADQERFMHSNGNAAAAAVPEPSNTTQPRPPNSNSNSNNASSTSSGTTAGHQQQRPVARQQYQRRPNYIRDFEVPADMSRLPPKFGDNQHIDIDNEVWEQLKAVVDTIHHKAPIRYAFAYGSGVFAQKGYDSKVNRDHLFFSFFFFFSFQCCWESSWVEDDRSASLLEQ